MTCDLSGTDFEFLRRRLARGEVVLFLGAGFSVDAKNRSGESLPLGGKLASMLAEKAGFPYTGEPLTNVYQAVIPRIGENELWRYLPEVFHVSSYADWYDLIPRFVWYRIYTINIDNLLEVIYSKSKSQTLAKIVCPAPPAERDPHFDTLQVVHLHGHVDHRDKGIIFSLAEFAQQTAGPNPWYQQLVDDLFNRSILFVGTPLLEPMLYHYIEARGLGGKLGEIRPQSYLVNSSIGPINAKAFQERNICSVECSAGDFFAALADSVDMSAHSLSAVRSAVWPHITFARSKGIANVEVERYFDLIVPHAYPPSPPMPPGAFFMGGEPTWMDIEKRHDGERQVTAELMAAAVSTSENQKMVVLHGPAGSGKSTTLMRLAAEIAREGAIVYFARQDERIDLYPLLQTVRLRVTNGDMKRVYIFIDVLSRHIGALDSLRPTLDSPLPISFVFADRDNGYFNKCQELSIYSPIEVKMPDLCEEDVLSILGRLETFGFLGALREKTKEQRVKSFMDVAEKQLLVAMREATSGRGFDSILRSEFAELNHDAKLAYTIAALAVAKGAPGVYRRHLLPALGSTDYVKHRIIDDLLRGVLVRSNATGTLLKPRHRLIAKWIADEIADTSIKIEATTNFLRQISADIIPNEIKRRSPAFLAYRGMINAAGLKETFGGDSMVILGLYDELKDVYGHDFLFWLQYGIAAIDAHHLDLGENYLNQSLAIRPDNHQALHHMGLLQIMKATRGENPVIETERALEGIRTLRQQIYERGDEESYPYHAYIVHVSRWYAKAGKLSEDKEWEELRSIGKVALKKYGREEMVVQAVREMETLYMKRAVRPETS